MNLGNLLAGETAVIRFRYAQLHRWQGDRLRFHLPTTIAPRYGDPLAAGYAPHQVPEHALTADHGFTLKLEIAGQLAQADFECPSHPVAVSDVGGSRVLTLSGGSRLMDRDFVLVLRAPATWDGEGTFAADGDGYVALASFHLPVPDRRDHAAALPQAGRGLLGLDGRRLDRAGPRRAARDPGPPAPRRSLHPGDFRLHSPPAVPGRRAGDGRERPGRGRRSCAASTRTWAGPRPARHSTPPTPAGRRPVCRPTCC